MHLQQFKYLKEYKGTFLIVSHNQEFLNDVVNVIFDVEFGKITRYRGNYQTYLVKKAMMMENYERQYASNQKERAKLEEYIQTLIDSPDTASKIGMAAYMRYKKLFSNDVMVSNTLNYYRQCINEFKTTERKV